MEDLQDKPSVKDVHDRRLSIKSWIIIFIICLVGTIILFFGFFFLELSVLDLISSGNQEFGELSLIAGIIAVIIAPFLVLFGYPLLIYLYRRPQV